MLKRCQCSVLWAWARRFHQDHDVLLQPDRLDELSDDIRQAVFELDYVTIKQLDEELAPIVGQLEGIQLPRPIRQAIRVLELVTWVRSARWFLERD